MDYGASLENWFPPGTEGSNPSPCATHELPAFGSYEDYLVKVRGNGPLTVETKVTIIGALKKRVSNLWDSSEVEQYIRDSGLSGGRKNSYGQSYRDWCKWKGFDYKPIRYRKQEKLPYVPTENEMQDSFKEYLDNTEFTEYRDLCEPIIGFSEDGSVAWSTVQVRVKGRSEGGNEIHDMDFTCAGITLYRREDGRLVRFIEASSFV